MIVSYKQEEKRRDEDASARKRKVGVCDEWHTLSKADLREFIDICLNKFREISNLLLHTDKLKTIFAFYFSCI